MGGEVTEAADAAGLPVLKQWADRLGAISGWRAWLLSGLLGVAATFALPPYHFWPVLYLVFPALLGMLLGERRRRSQFAIGWWFGFGYFAASLYWISHALLIFSDDLLWMVPFAALGLPAFLAFYVGLAGLALKLFKGPVAKILVFGTLWVMAEWLRGLLFTGFPWNLIGYAWGGSDAMIQFASLGGVYSLSLLLMLSVTLPVLLAFVPRAAGLAALALAVVIPLSLWGYGEARLNDVAPAQELAQDGPGMRIVQPAIPQREKWGRKYVARNFNHYLRLSKEQRPDWVKTVIWPETAATFYLENDATARRLIADHLPEDGLMITGAPRRDPARNSLHNSVLVLDKSGTVLESYDKAHLVPFGEYVPLRSVLPIDKVTHGMTDYSPGPGPRSLILPGLPPLSALVCYEAIFPGQVINASQRADWILNLTNDAWYGRTVGPYQHLNIVRMRAVEEGVAMVRAANTGVSAVFDAYGREVGRLELEQEGVLDFRLPPALEEATLYSLFGDGPVLLILSLILAVSVFAGNRSYPKQF